MSGDLKKNEARPIFRLMAGILAILSWSVLMVVIAASYYHLAAISGPLVLAISMSWIAVRGYLPRFLLVLFARGPVAQDDELR